MRKDTKNRGNELENFLNAKDLTVLEAKNELTPECNMWQNELPNACHLRPILGVFRRRYSPFKGF